MVRKSLPGRESIQEYRSSQGRSVKSITPTRVSEPFLTQSKIRTFGTAENGIHSVIEEIKTLYLLIMRICPKQSSAQRVLIKRIKALEKFGSQIKTKTCNHLPGL